MNCTTPTRWPRPSMRNASPNAAVDLPLPVPVWTISKPFSTVLPATSASCTALRFAILARWRAAASSSVEFIEAISSLYVQRQSGDEQHDPIGAGGDPLVEPTGGVAKAPRQRVVRDDAKADLVGDEHDRSAMGPERALEPRGG